MNDVLSADSLDNAVATGRGGFDSLDPKTLTHGGTLKKENYTTRGRPQKGNAHLGNDRIHRPKLKPGERIQHVEHGWGTILEEWGCWLSCTGCFEEVPNGKECTCGRSDIKIWVSGRGTYEVDFDDGIQRPCHQDRFTEARGVKYAVEISLTSGEEIAEPSDMSLITKPAIGPIDLQGHTPKALSAHSHLGDAYLEIEFGNQNEAESFYESLKARGFEVPRDADLKMNDDESLGLNIVIVQISALQEYSA